MALEASVAGLVRVLLPLPTREEILRASGVASVVTSDALEHYSRLFQNYFSGLNVNFDIPLDYGTSTSFRRRVWEAARMIPYGETRSYGWVAVQAGCPDGARAVGQALGANPLPVIVPCHRVIAADGGLGGFSGGLDMKVRLMEIEGDCKAQRSI